MILGIIKDVTGNDYVGIVYPEYFIKPYDLILEVLLSDKGYSDEKIKTIMENRIKRDGLNYHITVLPVGVYKEQNINLKVGDIEFLGIGTVSANDNETYYLVVKSQTLDNYRSGLGLKPIDFHITLGFDKKDVFGKRKNESTLIWNL